MSRSSLPRARLFDVLLALALVVAGLAEVWVPLNSRQGTGSAWWTSVGVLVLTPALAFRRSRPPLVAVVVLVGWPLPWIAHTPYVLFYGQFVVMGVVTYSVARWGTGVEPYAGGALRALTLVLGNALVPELRGPSEIVFDWGVSLLAWGAGFGLAAYQRRSADHPQRAIDAEVESASQTMAALVEEHNRIARELHDIVAHAVSMIVVQAGAAEQTVDDDPVLVRRALGAIRETGAGALGEMRRVVAVLREGKGGLAPQPGVDGVPELLGEARAAGLDARFAVRGTPRELPVGLVPCPRRTLGVAAGYDVVGEAADRLEAVARASETRPDVVLMDVRMPRLDGIEATRRILAAQPDVRVLALTTFDLDEYVYAAVRAGASGFPLEDVPPADPAHAVEVVARGEAMRAPVLTRRLLERFAADPAPGALPPEVARLSEREREVLRLASRGLSNEIGRTLFLSEATVTTYVSRLLTKLDLRDRVRLAILAYEVGLVRPGVGG